MNENQSPEEEFIVCQLDNIRRRIEAGNLSPEIIDVIKGTLEIMIPMLEIMKSQIRKEVN